MLHSALCQDSDLVSLDKERIGKIIQVVFICSGCDFVSYFIGQGKASFYKIFFQYCRFISGQSDQSFGSLHQTNQDSRTLGLLAFYRLIGCVYFQSNRVALNDFDSPEQIFNKCDASDIVAQHHEFLDVIRKGTWKGEFEDTLLPSNAALELHWGRCCWVSQVWDSASVPQFDYPLLTDYGWKIENGKVAIKWDDPENVKAIHENVAYLTRGCGCKKSECKDGKCKCKKAGHACGPGCTCKNCKNTETCTEQDQNVEQNTDFHQIRDDGHDGGNTTPVDHIGVENDNDHETDSTHSFEDEDEIYDSGSDNEGDPSDSFGVEIYSEEYEYELEVLSDSDADDFDDTF